MRFEDSFEVIPFPEQPNIVYVVAFRRGSDYVPFYVGQSTRNIGRIGDYVSAQFSCSTDFRVGRTVRLLKERGCEIVVAYKPSSNPRGEERELKTKFKDLGFLQLDELDGYDYRHSTEDQELERLRQFVNRLATGRETA
jgi:hypothetical protein